MKQPALRKLRVLSEIAKGTYARVFRAVQTDTGLQVAIKRTRKYPKSDETYWNRLRAIALKESRILRSLRNSPHVIRFMGQIDTPDKDIVLVLEYVPVSLEKVLETARMRLVTREQQLALIDDFFAAMDSVHTQGIIHGDVKPSNVLVDRLGKVKIADFGLSLEQNGSFDDELIPGTLWYRAPEVLLGSEIVNPAIDNWAVGCVAAEIFRPRRILFTAPTEHDQIKLLLEQVFGGYVLETWPGIQKLEEYHWYKDVTTVITTNTSQNTLNSGIQSLKCYLQSRLFSAGSRQNQFTDSVLELVSGLLHLNPEVRFTASDALDKSQNLIPGKRTPIGVDEISWKNLF